MTNISNYILRVNGFLVLVISLWSGSCTKLVDIDPPRTDLVRETVFASNAAAESAVRNIYYQMQSGNFASGSTNSFTLTTSFSSDESIIYSGSVRYAAFEPFYNNAIISTGPINLNLWEEPYKYLYQANSIIEGLESSTGVTAELKQRLIGEAKFIRAFSHFYLFNLFGEIPLAVTTDYVINKNMERSSTADIYEQIISDLKDAIALLPNDYSNYNNERVRVNQASARALLARTYLYKGDWQLAEEQSSLVIDNPLYVLEDLDNVFAAVSKEAIWQLWSQFNPQNYITFYISTIPDNGSLRNSIVSSFENDDQRKTYWIGLVNGYYFSNKYKNFDVRPDYSTVLRLAEVYLIRAEARAMQNNLTGANSAVSDINAVRTRAGLSDITSTLQQDILDDILTERNHELFCENGHRWFDLKRLGKLNEIMMAVKPDTWKPTAALYPIPHSQVINSKIKQNPGYDQ